MASVARALRSGNGKPAVRGVLPSRGSASGDWLHSAAYATRPGGVALQYTARVTVRHHELDCFGRVHPGVYLRYLAQAAIDASADLGYDAAWYAAAGGRWIIRRSTLALARPVTAGEDLVIRTWVEDFRRVRSERRYELWSADGGLCGEARTDWVYVDAETGRPRRVPRDLEAAFAARAPGATPRSAWSAPPPPPMPARSTHR